MATDYSGTTTAQVEAVLASIPVSTKNAIIHALSANGLLGGNASVGILSEVNPGSTTVVNGNQEQVVLLGSNSNTQVFSNKPVVVGLDSGTNFVNINRPNTARDQADTVVGGSGKDTIVGNTSADSLVAGSGTEYIASGGGKDTIRGGSGRDTLTGGGQSSIVAGSGRTTIQAGQAVSGYKGAVHDTVQAGTGKDSISLSYGNNTVYAPTGGGAATINAGSGYDTIYGPTARSGAETINAGAHTTLQLDTGTVNFNIKSGNADTIFGGNGAGFVVLNQAANSPGKTDSYTTSTDKSGNTVLTFASGGSITTVGQVNFVFKPK